MNITLDKTSPVSAEITIKMGKEDYAPKVEKAIKEYSRKVQMPGFRAGKVPVALVKKMYGTQAKADEVNKLLQDSLFNYILENKVNMLGQPLGSEKQEPQDIEQQDDFTFIFDVALAPEFNIELNNADTVDYYDIEVAEETITKQLDALRQQAGHPEAVDTYQDRAILRGTLAELDENGQPKEGGIVVEEASLMPTYFKNEDQKKIFASASTNEVITFNPTVAYDNNETELSQLFKIVKEEVKNHAGDFSFEVNSISIFAPAELNQEFYDRVFGEGKVTDEEGCRNKIKENIVNVQTNDSDFKFLMDVRAYAEAKVGELEFPVELLKKIMKANNQEKEESYVEDNFDKSIAELKWHLIKEQLVKARNIKVEDADMKAAAMEATRYQFMQMGLNNIPDEYLAQAAEGLLKDKKRVDGLIERCIDQKLTAALKGELTLNHKAISAEDFAKMFD